MVQLKKFRKLCVTRGTKRIHKNMIIKTNRNITCFGTHVNFNVNKLPKKKLNEFGKYSTKNCLVIFNFVVEKTKSLALIIWRMIFKSYS